MDKTGEIFRRLISEGVRKHKYCLPNVFFGRIELDVFALTNSGYTYEYEVKISRSDFLADKNKREKHDRYSKALNKEIISGFTPNRFYYVCPEGMIAPGEVPEYAGLIYFDGNYLKEIKPAPFIHKTKILESLYRQIVDKCYHRYIHKYQKLGV